MLTIDHIWLFLDYNGDIVFAHQSSVDHYTI